MTTALAPQNPPPPNPTPRESKPMTNAAITYVYNESVNLPIWVRHYGGAFGHENLFVIDRCSTDGSTANIGANIIQVPRTAFDDHKKSAAISHLHAALLQSYDCVVVSDCDEILVPDPAKYTDLAEYIDKMPGAYATAMGFNVTHIIDREPALDLRRPILDQRGYLSFNSTMCKPLISKIPQTWAPGLHAVRMPPALDPDLLVFHLKTMDMGIAQARQRINNETEWSEASIAANHGNHHRQHFTKFMRDVFFSAAERVNTGPVHEFDGFEKIIADLVARTHVGAEGFHHVPFGVNAMFRLPERFWGRL
jgi:hypothetical protein